MTTDRNESKIQMDPTIFYSLLDWVCSPDRLMSAKQILRWQAYSAAFCDFQRDIERIWSARGDGHWIHVVYHERHLGPLPPPSEVTYSFCSTDFVRVQHYPPGGIAVCPHNLVAITSTFPIDVAWFYARAVLRERRREEFRKLPTWLRASSKRRLT